jgi:hypothetical protein
MNTMSAKRCVYAITATASDLAGNIPSATATCKVPHDRRQTAKP